MLDDAQHAEVKRLLKKALEEKDWRLSQFALEDAAKIVGVKCSEFVAVPFMPAPRKIDSDDRKISAR